MEYYLRLGLPEAWAVAAFNDAKNEALQSTNQFQNHQRRVLGSMLQSAQSAPLPSAPPAQAPAPQPVPASAPNVAASGAPVPISSHLQTPQTSSNFARMVPGHRRPQPMKIRVTVPQIPPPAPAQIRKKQYCIQRYWSEDGKEIQVQLPLDKNKKAKCRLCNEKYKATSKNYLRFHRQCDQVERLIK